MNTIEIKTLTLNQKKFLHLVLAFVLAIFSPKIASFVADIYQVFFASIDPDKVFVWMYIHHLVQLFLALFVMALPFWNKSFKDWGFNLDHSGWSLRTVGHFCIGWIIFSALFMLVIQVPPLVTYPLTTSNLIGDLFFDFIMTGISEEVLFRAMVMGILLLSWKSKIRIRKFEVSAAGLLAAIIFALAHIGFDLMPFQITYVNTMQLVFAFGLGIFYAVMFDKTGSLLGPILAHGASDGLLTVIYLVIN